MKASTDSFVGTSSRLLEEVVLKKVDMYESMLAQIAERCKEERVTCNDFFTTLQCNAIYKFPRASIFAMH